MTAAPRNPTSFRERDDWMRAVNASGEPRAARCLAFAIALHLNVKTGRCDPGHKTLSKDAHISERSVERFVALLEHRGWLAIKRGGRGHNNSYVLLRPASDLADQIPDRPARDLADQDSLTDYDPPVSAHMTRQFRSHDPPHAGGQKARKAKREKKGKSQTQAPDVASLGSKGDAAAAFDEFWKVYPRRVAKEAARKAYIRAVKEGHDPLVINAGGERYRAERAGQDPRYTKHPATWINGHCWQDEPAGGTVIDQDGNPVAVEQPPPPKRSGVTVVAEEMLRRMKGNYPW